VSLKADTLDYHEVSYRQAKYCIGGNV